MIDKEHKELSEKLNMFKEKKMKELKTEEDEVDGELVRLKGFQNTLKEILGGGSALDICHSAGGLLTDAETIIKAQKVMQTSQQRVDRDDVKFVANSMHNNSGYGIRLIGLLEYYCDAQNTICLPSTCTEISTLRQMCENLQECRCRLQELQSQTELLDNVTALIDQHAYTELVLMKHPSIH